MPHLRRQLASSFARPGAFLYQLPSLGPCSVYGYARMSLLGPDRALDFNLGYSFICVIGYSRLETNRYTLASSILNRQHDPRIWISSSRSSFHLRQVRCCKLPSGRCICELPARMVVFGDSSVWGGDAAKVIGPRAVFVSLRLCGGVLTIVGNPICEVVSL